MNDVKLENVELRKKKSIYTLQPVEKQDISV